MLSLLPMLHCISLYQNLSNRHQISFRCNISFNNTKVVKIAIMHLGITSCFSHVIELIRAVGIGQTLVEFHYYSIAFQNFSLVNNLTGNTLVISTDEFAVTFFGFNLGGFEVILGVEFLRTLGSHPVGCYGGNLLPAPARQPPPSVRG